MGGGSSTPVQQPHQAAAERAFCPATGSWTWPRGFPRPGPLATSCGLPATSALLCSGSWTDAAQPSRSPCRGRGCPSSLSPRHCREAGPLLTYSAGVTRPPPRAHTHPAPSPLLFPVTHLPTRDSRRASGPPLQPMAPGLWAMGLGRAMGPVLRRGAPGTLPSGVRYRFFLPRPCPLTVYPREPPALQTKARGLWSLLPGKPLRPMGSGQLMYCSPQPSCTRLARGP